MYAIITMVIKLPPGNLLHTLPDICCYAILNTTIRGNNMSVFGETEIMFSNPSNIHQPHHPYIHVCKLYVHSYSLYV